MTAAARPEQASSGHGARAVHATEVDSGPDKQDPPVSLPFLSPFLVSAWRAPSVSARPRCHAYVCPPPLTSGPDLPVAPFVRLTPFPPPDGPNRRPMGPAR